MNTEIEQLEPKDTLPNKVLDKHRVRSGNYKAGDFLIDNLDGSVYSVSNIEIDKITRLEARLIKERQDTVNDIQKVYVYVSDNYNDLKDRINEEKKDTDNRIFESWKKLHDNSIFLQDMFRENKIKINEELQSLRQTLFWITVLAFTLIGSICFALTYVFSKL